MQVGLESVIELVRKCLLQSAPCAQLLMNVYLSTPSSALNISASFFQMEISEFFVEGV